MRARLRAARPRCAQGVEETDDVAALHVGDAAEAALLEMVAK